MGKSMVSLRFYLKLIHLNLNYIGIHSGDFESDANDGVSSERIFCRAASSRLQVKSEKNHRKTYPLVN